MRTKNRKGLLDDLVVEPMVAEMDCVNYETREILLDGYIDQNTIRNYVMPIIRINKEDNDMELSSEERIPITIYMNCYGGDSNGGNALIDAITCSKTPIIGINIGVCYSMALPVLLACGERYAFKNCSFLWHDGTLGIQHSGNKVKDQFAFMVKQDEKIQDFIVEHSNISSALLKRKSKDEWFFDAQSALEMKVIDEILDTII